ncbi:MAG: hypothetical protein ACLFUJ_10525 [Phycisphaerae bacterium]
MHRSVKAVTFSLTALTLLIVAAATVRLAGGPESAGASGAQDRPFQPGPLPAELQRLAEPLKQEIRRQAVLLDQWNHRRKSLLRLRDQLQMTFGQLRMRIENQLDTCSAESVSLDLLRDQLALLDIEQIQANRLSWLGRLEARLEAMGIEGQAGLIADLRNQASRCRAADTEIGALEVELARSTGVLASLAGQLRDQANQRLMQALDRQDRQAGLQALKHAQWAGQLDQKSRMLAESWTAADGETGGRDEPIQLECIAQLHTLSTGPRGGL